MKAKYSSYGVTANVQHPVWNEALPTHRLKWVAPDGMIGIIHTGTAEKMANTLAKLDRTPYESRGRTLVIEEIRR